MMILPFLLAVLLGGLSLFFGQGRLSFALMVACVLFALVPVVHYIATLSGHDPWRKIRREHQRRKRSRR